MRFPFTQYGARELAALTIFMAAGIIAGLIYFLPLAVVCGAGLLFGCFFFRDPKRRIPNDPNAILAPADGKVVDVSKTDRGTPLDEPAWKIDIFLSVLNVHINRAPCAGKVASVRYSPGKFLNALRKEASAENESNLLGLIMAHGRGAQVFVRQIAGVIARRIVCACEVGDELGRGEAFGMIKFGSRTEVYIPESSGFVPEVEVGSRVRAGETILGRLP